MMYREKKFADTESKDEKQKAYQTECGTLAVVRGLDVGRSVSPLR